MANIKKKIENLKPGKEYLLTVRAKNADLNVTSDYVESIRFTVPQDQTNPDSINNLKLYSGVETVMFVFDFSGDKDISRYEYELYEPYQVELIGGYYEPISGQEPINKGFNDANVFSVTIDNLQIATPSFSETLGLKKFLGRVRGIDTTGNAGPWTNLVETDDRTPLIDNQFIGSLTASKITAGTIGAHTIQLNGVNSILKSSNFNGIASSTPGQYDNVTEGWLVNGYGNSYFANSNIRGEVNASDFNLLDNDGNVVASLGPGLFTSVTFDPLAYTIERTTSAYEHALNFYHLDKGNEATPSTVPFFNDSGIVWTIGDSTNQSINIVGPGTQGVLYPLAYADAPYIQSGTYVTSGVGSEYVGSTTSMVTSVVADRNNENPPEIYSESAGKIELRSISHNDDIPIVNSESIITLLAQSTNSSLNYHSQLMIGSGFISINSDGAFDLRSPDVYLWTPTGDILHSLGNGQVAIGGASYGSFWEYGTRGVAGFGQSTLVVSESDDQSNAHLSLRHSNLGTGHLDGLDLALTRSSGQAYIIQRRNANLNFRVNDTTTVMTMFANGTSAIYYGGVKVLFTGPDASKSDTSTFLYSEAVYARTTTNGTNVNVDSVGRIRRSTSSRRYKENIETWTSSLADVLNLRPVSFTGKFDEPENKILGLIAEEVEQINPQAVVYGPDGQVESINYNAIIDMLINAVKELNQEIQTLKQKM